MDEDDLEVVRQVRDVNNIININNPNNRIYRNREDPFVKYTDKEFRKKYRFCKENIPDILNLIHGQLNEAVDNLGLPVNVELQLLCALRYYGRNMIEDDVGDLHGVSQPTISRIIRKVSIALCQIKDDFIYMPRNRDEEQYLMKGFFEFANCPKIIGSIDGTHIPIADPGGPFSQMYINRKGYFSLNCQAVVAPDGRFQDVARWRDSAHDSRIFNESRLKARFENREFKGLLIGDSGYAASEYMLTPILNPQNERERRYNAPHILTRGIVEKAFGRLKKKFRCLLKGINLKLDTAEAIIIATMVLHNLYILWHGFEEEEDDDDDESDDEDNHLPHPDQPDPGMNTRGSAFQNACYWVFFITAQGKFFRCIRSRFFLL